MQLRTHSYCNRRNRQKQRRKNIISALIVPTDTPGLTITSPYDKMGVRGSNTAEILLEDVRVPAANLLGDPTKGFKQFLYTLDGGRISIAALAVGIAQAALDASLAYAKERKQFGQPISSFQAIQFKLADMAMEIDLARQMVLKAAWLKDHNHPFTKEARTPSYSHLKWRQELAIKPFKSMEVQAI